ncbi:MAG: elongation factor G [Bryobacterales bacterium]|nr:elongation factor G [Bryobacteraceae bacterium]MDW8353834.1 elongation factor G [Bryobacterales bacterium]
MKVYGSPEIRNVALLGHGHCGKTSLAAGILYLTGATNRLTSVDEGNTLTDFDPEEVQRKLTISTGVAFAEWKKHKINLLDTPGFNLFLNDTQAALVAADAALVLVDGVAGVEVQTEKVWHFCNQFHLPRALVVNRLDRELSSFERALESIHQNFGRAAVPVQLPLGSEREFSGIVDLVRMKCYTYGPEPTGRGREIEIPAALSSAAAEAHEALVEMIAEGNDALMEEFFDKGTLPLEHLVDGLRAAVKESRLFPVLCASATRNIGTDLLLDFALEFFPPPNERGPVTGTVSDGQTATRAIADSEPVSAFVFKTMADPFAGRVSYFKVFSGVLKNDANLLNTRSGNVERLSHIGCPLGKEIRPVTELHAGDIGVVAKLKDTLTGDTLSDKAAPITYPKVKLPEPSIAFAIEAKTRQDEDRMGSAIQRILEEDSSLRFYRDPQTKEFLLAGTGQQHIEIAVSKLKNRYGVDVTLKAPKIPYRETIRGTADVQGRHKKQTGGHGQFGDCRIRMEPLPRGANFEFVNQIFGGAIPKQYIPAVEKGILEAAEEGYLAGYPVVDFRVILYDGAYHEVDSSELSFKLAARKAFRAAMEQAKPALLEPIMNVEVQAPVEFAGDLMGDLNGRRGRITGMDTRGNMQIIRAQVPMAEMLTYQSDLISMTQGRGSFTMEFSHYDFVPQAQAEKIIAAARAAKAGVEEEEE